MIEIVSTTALATVQDFGRFGSLGYGVGTSGAMDPLALALGNLLLGNPEDAAAIEIPMFAFDVRFIQDCAFAVTGAACEASLDGQPLPPNWVAQAREGQVLSLGYPSSGSRAYLCLPGGVDVPSVLGSRSTQLRGEFGGLHGRALQQGDRLAVLRPGVSTQPTDFGVVSPSQALPLQCDGLPAMRVLPAAEYAGFTDESRAAFWAGEWKVTPQSNRYGYRLEGAPILPKVPMEIRSHGIVPGVIQVPHGGQPIIQMRDAQPSGGYPKFGTVIEADLWRLGQAPIGSNVRFIECSYAEAIAALADNQRYLVEVRRLVDLHGLASR
ncbi:MULTISPECIES: biotin-dependent carboxyltransferase family protein [Pseudomonas]|uniref:5-oxoprolinase subunit C family protein n=1 Tax=Pseudomonas TaxID=286 RepID=UPI000C8816AA|nr:MULTISPECIES: biotin-dependent carboxyltransferase family protein [unclassified Pseudomonas]PMX23387.1 allophanate hydrolase [Pseudomonas sp. GW460-12]PMX32272.1 allophanate hydrolase [Pseudomonas sp. MPR-R2A4]PMX39591.1 allophanate hydrolase [Pseudomonas sp. MPR-R2A7]PMX52333.1 allophanate hydrolase [Pseudomonas sp. MPR-R2A6]PMX89078.1 allophanate hydrolase [Pseudomonas sp. MPR-R2A3]